ncbi:helix-turn-helix domain-containing protein [uncultured Bilophila sp.]|uniref:winged helix-turn-helix transcriptional regulator n=1 Tax=uncultured Bilophila sp. TaxID=529385 RepID=UPI00280BF29A|nr:helix-turn-helix domain-containing protein [uncultured Bilophila sp.]
MKIRKTCTCPLEIVHDIMKGKWKTIIVFQLRNGGMGLADLERGIEGITQKMLLQHLRELRDFGLIGKIEPEGYPLRVTYFLTERGKNSCGPCGSCRTSAWNTCWRTGRPTFWNARALSAPADCISSPRHGRHGWYGLIRARWPHTHQKVRTVLSPAYRYRGGIIGGTAWTRPFS